jgi:hypothetical protein
MMSERGFTKKSVSGLCGAILAMSIIFLWGTARAQDLGNEGEIKGAEGSVPWLGVSAQREKGSIISDQRYADGPSLWNSGKIGAEYLLGGLAADEVFTVTQKRVKKIKKAVNRTE